MLMCPTKHLPKQFVIVQNDKHQLDSKGNVHPLHSLKCAFKSHQSALKAMNKLISIGFTNLKIYQVNRDIYLGSVW